MGKNKGLVEELETRPALDPEHLCAGGVNGDDVSNSVNANNARFFRLVNTKSHLSIHTHPQLPLRSLTYIYSPNIHRSSPPPGVNWCNDYESAIRGYRGSRKYLV